MHNLAGHSLFIYFIIVNLPYLKNFQHDHRKLRVGSLQEKLKVFGASEWKIIKDFNGFQSKYFPIKFLGMQREGQWTLINTNVFHNLNSFDFFNIHCE